MPNKITAALARGRQLVKVIDLRLHDKTSYQLLQQIDLTFPPLSLDYTEIRFYQNLTSYQLIKGLLSLSLALTLPAFPFFPLRTLSFQPFSWPLFHSSSLKTRNITTIKKAMRKKHEFSLKNSTPTIPLSHSL